MSITAKHTIASAIVPGTATTITITLLTHSDCPNTTWYRVTCDSSSGLHFSCGRATETKAREAANRIWAHEVTLRDAAATTC